MRIASIQTNAGPRAAVQVGAEFVILPFTMMKLLENGEAGLDHARRTLERGGQIVGTRDAKYLAPVPDPHKIICLGLNYRDHAEESGAKIPKDPVLFSKYATALIGHNENIVLPAISEEVDFEAELVIVVGKKGRNIKEEDAMSHIGGYTIGHDVSARDWQLKKDGGQWMVGKTFDTFAPCGPVLVTPDEIEEPHSLPIKLTLNGQVMQDGNTSNMIFGIPRTLAFLSSIMTLEPGDLIFTGTPPGVGFARTPPVFLKKDDVVEIEIEGIGTLKNTVVMA